MWFKQCHLSPSTDSLTFQHNEWYSILISIQRINLVLKSCSALLQQSDQSVRFACVHLDARTVERSPQTALKNITE